MSRNLFDLDKLTDEEFEEVTGNTRSYPNSAQRPKKRKPRKQKSIMDRVKELSEEDKMELVRQLMENL